MRSLRMRSRETTARSIGGGRAILLMSVQVHSLTELQNVCARLRGISGVSEVRRGTD